MHYSLAEAAAILSGVQLMPASAGDICFTGVSLNTRTLLPGNLFVALAGSQMDGHDCLPLAQQAGAVAALVQRPVPAARLPQLLVSDTAMALGALSAAWRAGFQLSCVAITGSNGKTTVKNIVAAILIAATGDDGTVLATVGTRNNHLGLPLTLAQLEQQHRYLVLEMGMNHPGEIAYLSRLARPTVALITQAAAAHLAGVGQLEDVARAKSEIVQGLDPDGVMVLNRDDAYFTYWQAQAASYRQITFGRSPQAEVSLKQEVCEHARVSMVPHAAQPTPLVVRIGQDELPLQCALLGEHNAANVLAAIAVTLALRIPWRAIQQGIASVKPAAGRLQPTWLSPERLLLDDTYNANPGSLMAAIATIAAYPGMKVVVLGDMQELGDQASSWHARVGEQMKHCGVHYLLAYGPLMRQAVQTFGEGGYHFTQQAELIYAMHTLLQAVSSPVTILVKGSRSMQMEHVVASLKRSTS